MAAKPTIFSPRPLNKDETHALLRATGLSTHGLAVINHALVLLLLQLFAARSGRPTQGKNLMNPLIFCLPCKQ